MLLFPMQRFVCSKADLIKTPLLCLSLAQRGSQPWLPPVLQRRVSPLARGAAHRLPGNPCSRARVQLSPFPKALIPFWRLWVCSELGSDAAVPCKDWYWLREQPEQGFCSHSSAFPGVWDIICTSARFEEARLVSVSLTGATCCF